jgi:hypothetical protein
LDIAAAITIDCKALAFEFPGKHEGFFYVVRRGIIREVDGL